MKSSVESAACAVKAIIFDVDGVLTNGSIMYGPEGEWKVFHVQDGHGIKLAARAGLKIGFLTGRSSPAVTRRAEELGVDAFADGIRDKGACLVKMLEDLGVSAEEVCYVGDDVVDLPALDMVGMPVAVANAVAEVKASAIWVTEHKGGQGAAREVIEFILKAKQLWEGVMQRYQS